MFITFVWGSTFVLVKNALLDAGPLTFNAVRFGSSAVILAMFSAGTWQISAAGPCLPALVWGSAWCGLPVPEPWVAADHTLEVGLSDRHFRRAGSGLPGSCFGGEE